MKNLSSLRRQVSVLFVILLLLGLGGCQKRGMLGTFLTPTLQEEPEWNIYQEEKLEFRFVEAKLSSSWKGEYAMGITVEITNPTDKPISIGQSFSVEYEYEGEWHYLFSWDMFMMSSVYLEPRATVTEVYDVPLYIFSGTGKYRLYIPNGGYCEIPGEFD